MKNNWLRIVFLVTILSLTLMSCDQSNDENEAVMFENRNTTTLDPITVYANVSGIVKHSDSADSPNSTRQPLEGVTVSAYYSGMKNSSETDENGFWHLTDVPVGDGAGSNISLALYFSKYGYKDASPDSNVLIISPVGIGSLTGFNVNAGTKILFSEQLAFSSNLVHPAANTQYWYNNDTTTDIDDVDEVYLKTASSNITLAFNMPIDTTYTGLEFIELLDTGGSAVGYSGSWSSSKTEFTIDPSGDLDADNDDRTKYVLRTIKQVRAFGAQDVITELDRFQILFNVLESSGDDSLASQAPVLDPAVDNYTSFEFDSATAYGKRLQINGTDDYQAALTNLTFSWDQIADANQYRLYYRNSKNNQTGLWTEISGSQTENADSTVNQSISLYNLMDDSKLTSGETLTFVVTAEDEDGSESSIGEVSSPLTISDNYSPRVLSGSYDATPDDQPSNQTNLANSSVNGDISATFTEDMNTTSSSATPQFTTLSGLIAISDVTTDNYWQDTTTYVFKNVTSDFTVSSVTLTYPIASGDFTIRVNSVGKLMVGDTLDFYESNEGNGQLRTISEIDSSNNLITFTAAFSADFGTSTTSIRLYSSSEVPGLTAFRTTLSASMNIGDTTITLDDASVFNGWEKSDIDIYSLDDDAQIILEGSVEIDSISGDDVTLSSSATFHTASGAIVVLDGLTVSEPVPRSAGSITTLSQEVTLDADSFSTTITAAQEDQDNDLVVANTSGFAVGDKITIGATTVTGSTPADLDGTTNTITFSNSSHGFVKYDLVRIIGVDVQTTVSSPVASTQSSITLGADTVVGDTIIIKEDAYNNNLTATAGTGTTTLSLGTTSGLAPNQSITLRDGQNSETVTISTINGSNSVDITTGITTADGFDSATVVTRSELSETKTVQTGATSGGTTITTVVFGNSYSTNATVTIDRDSADYNIIDVSGATITLNSNPCCFADGAIIQLRSLPEIRTISTVSFDRLTLTSIMNYSHHIGASVSKSRTSVLNVASLPNSTVIGDTVIIDTDKSAMTIKDRIEGIITAIDTANNLVTISTSATGIIPASANVTFMADSITLTNAADSNGNTMTTTYGLNHTSPF